MDIGRRGDMGFAEAIIAFMAVTVVLSAYLGLAVHVQPSVSDPASGLSEEMFTGTVSDGVFIPSYTDSLGDFLDASGCRGISVSVTVPGGFCDGIPPVTVGSMDGPTSARTFSGTVSDDKGRTFPAFFEVTVCR